MLRWDPAQSQHVVGQGFALSDELHPKRPVCGILRKGKVQEKGYKRISKKVERWGVRSRRSGHGL